METKLNIEIQTARRMIEILKKHAPDEVVEAALANEREIIRLADRVAQTLTIMARDYTAMAEEFDKRGIDALNIPCYDLPELKAQLVCRINAQKLYCNLLK